MSMYVETNSLISNGNIRSGNKKKVESYKRLKENIKGTGAILQAITVYDVNGNYVILDGHQRHSIAKDLKMENVPIHIIDKPNGNTELFQYSTNHYRVEMTLYEEIIFYTNLVNQENGLTVKQIAEKFGHSAVYVKERLQLGNLHSDLLFPEMNPENKNNLLIISTYDLSLQDTAIDIYCEDFDIERKEFAIDLREEDESHWNVLSEIKAILRKRTPVLDDFALFNDKEIAEYKKSYAGPIQTSLKLFDDVEWMTEDFLNHCYVSKYEDLCSLLESFPKLEDKSRYDYRLIKVPIDKLNGYKNPEKIINSRYIAWNGDITNIRFKLKPKKDEEKTVVETKHKYYGQLKRFHKAVCPLINDHVRTNIDVNHVLENDQFTTFIWMYDFGKYMSIGRHHEDLDQCTVQDAWKRLNEYWYKNAIIDSNLVEINTLCAYQDITQLKEVIFLEYENNEDFRKQVLNCFQIKVLNETFNTNYKKKSDAVTELAADRGKGKNTFPFIDLFQKETFINEWQKLPLCDGLSSDLISWCS